jgi:hypothetical protein
MTPILSQSDTRTESYDKNIEMRAEIFLKLEKRPDGVALPSERLLFPDPCLNMKSNFYSDSE